MTDLVYYLLSGVCVALVLLGINLMSKVKLSVTGNALSAIAMVSAMAVTVFRYGIFSPVTLYVALIIGAVIGIIGAIKVKMIAMPQTIALLNGLGGAASALDWGLRIDSPAFRALRGLFGRSLGLLLGGRRAGRRRGVR